MALNQKKLFRMNQSRHCQMWDMLKLDDSTCYETMFHTHLGAVYACKVEAVTNHIDGD